MFIATSPFVHQGAFEVGYRPRTRRSSRSRHRLHGRRTADDLATRTNSDQFGLSCSSRIRRRPRTAPETRNQFPNLWVDRIGHTKPNQPSQQAGCDSPPRRMIARPWTEIRPPLPDTHRWIDAVSHTVTSPPPCPTVTGAHYLSLSWVTGLARRWTQQPSPLPPRGPPPSASPRAGGHWRSLGGYGFAANSPHPWIRVWRSGRRPSTLIGLEQESHRLLQCGVDQFDPDAEVVPVIGERYRGSVIAPATQLQGQPARVRSEPSAPGRRSRSRCGGGWSARCGPRRSRALP